MVGAGATKGPGGNGTAAQGGRRLQGAAWRLTGRRVGAATEREKLATANPHCSGPTEAVLGKDDW